MQSTVTLNTDKLQVLANSLKGIAKSYVKLGVRSDRNSRYPVYDDEDSGSTNSEIARKHEFGEGKIPQRSILLKPITLLMGSRLSKVNIDEIGTVLDTIGQIGLKLVDDNFEAQGIAENWPKLSESTLMHRYENDRINNRILQDSYQLQESFGYEVVK